MRRQDDGQAMGGKHVALKTGYVVAFCAMEKRFACNDAESNAPVILVFLLLGHAGFFDVDVFRLMDEKRSCAKF